MCFFSSLAHVFVANVVTFEMRETKRSPKTFCHILNDLIDIMVRNGSSHSLRRLFASQSTTILKCKVAWESRVPLQIVDAIRVNAGLVKCLRRNKMISQIHWPEPLFDLFSAEQLCKHSTKQQCFRYAKAKAKRVDRLNAANHSIFHFIDHFPHKTWIEHIIYVSSRWKKERWSEVIIVCASMHHRKENQQQRPRPRLFKYWLSAYSVFLFFFRVSPSIIAAETCMFPWRIEHICFNKWTQAAIEWKKYFSSLNSWILSPNEIKKAEMIVVNCFHCYFDDFLL